MPPFIFISAYAFCGLAYLPPFNIWHYVSVYVHRCFKLLVSKKLLHGFNRRAYFKVPSRV